MSKRKPQFDFWTIVTIGILAVFALFLIYPLISLFVDGFLEEGTGAFTMANFTKFFGKKFYYRSLLNSLKLTVCVTICSLLIGVPLAYIMSFFKIRGKGVIEILIIISMMSPNFIGAYSWILLLGRSGVITQFLSNTFGIKMPSIYGFGGMLLVFRSSCIPSSTCTSAARSKRWTWPYARRPKAWAATPSARSLPWSCRWSRPRPSPRRCWCS